MSFTVEAGEIFGILGPNGVGKTTSVECITGLRKPDGGRISVLGLDPLAEPWVAEQAGQAGRGGLGGGDLRSVLDALVGVALDQRQAARQRKDYAAADTIRDQLQEAGVVVEDTPRGPRWELRR